MEYNELITALEPRGNGTFEKEPFEIYYQRVGHYLPNVPECPFEQWIYKQYSDIDDYAFLDFRKMKFEKEIWSKDKIFNEINSYGDNHRIDSHGFQIYNNRFNGVWLKKYMIENLTWPVPIIAFENHSHEKMGKPFHLLEGHTRLNYFRAIYRKEKEKLLDNHFVWKVAI